jgi:hypothetical protein
MPKVKTKSDKTRPPRLLRQYLRDQQWVFDHESDLAEDDSATLLLGLEGLLTNARLVCDYPKSKAFLQV